VLGQTRELVRRQAGEVMRAGLLGSSREDERHSVVPKPAGGEDDRFGGFGVQPLFVVDHHQKRCALRHLGE